MKNKIVLFDLDGTLIDSTQAIYESFCTAFKAFKKNTPNIESIKKIIGYTFEDILITLAIEEIKYPQYITA